MLNLLFCHPDKKERQTEANQGCPWVLFLSATMSSRDNDLNTKGGSTNQYRTFLRTLWIRLQIIIYLGDGMIPQKKANYSLDHIGICLLLAEPRVWQNLHFSKTDLIKVCCNSLLVLQNWIKFARTLHNQEKLPIFE